MIRNHFPLAFGITKSAKHDARDSRNEPYATAAGYSLSVFDFVAFASTTLDLLVNAAARFSAAIGQQLVVVQNDPAPADFAEKTVAYAEAKVAYLASTLRLPHAQNIGIIRVLL